MNQLTERKRFQQFSNVILFSHLFSKMSASVTRFATIATTVATLLFVLGSFRVDGQDIDLEVESMNNAEDGVISTSENGK
jgi:2-keto-4-pentenoate hydratase